MPRKKSLTRILLQEKKLSFANREKVVRTFFGRNKMLFAKNWSRGNFVTRNATSFWSVTSFSILPDSVITETRMWAISTRAQSAGRFLTRLFQGILAIIFCSWMVKFVVGKYQNVFQVENSPVTLILRVIFACGVTWFSERGSHEGAA